LDGPEEEDEKVFVHFETKKLNLNEERERNEELTKTNTKENREEERKK
jgi:hypothetical protein